jgi:hypothetical protein
MAIFKSENKTLGCGRYPLGQVRPELHRGPAVVSVTPLAFDLLEYLIRNN